MGTRMTKEELLDLERQYWQALKNKDAETAIRLTDDQCILTGAQGVGRIERKALAAMVQDTSYTLDRFELTKAEVRTIGDDVAIIAYQVHEELTVDGKPVSFDAADASTWIRRDGSWKCALHTESIAGDPFGRDKHGVSG